jgi:hypothetical protein
MFHFIGKGFKIQCVSGNSQVIEKTLHTPDLRNFTFNRLNCGSRYEFSIQAINDAGQSDRSSPILVKTNGSGKNRHLLINAVFEMRALRNCRRVCIASQFVRAHSRSVSFSKRPKSTSTDFGRPNTLTTTAKRLLAISSCTLSLLPKSRAS